VTHPIDGIVWTPATDLEPNPWNPNRVHKAELRLLERSLLLTGWIQPVLANPDGLIIDGFHRWRLAQDSKAVSARDAGMVPVARLDVTRPQAMLMTVRINRAKGIHVALEMHRLVHDLLENHGYTVETVMTEMGATRDEVEALAASGLFAARGTSTHAYSKAWYPIEDGRTIQQSRDDLKTKARR
jgi:ParB-like chromosome segregation protein Spo0J